MTITQENTNDLTILQLSGRLTIDESPGLIRQRVTDLVARGVRHVVIDLSQVRSIDSMRLGELVAAHVALQRIGGRLVLAGTPPRVLELLERSNLAGVFERVDSVEAAMAAPVG